MRVSLIERERGGGEEGEREKERRDRGEVNGRDERTR